MNQLPEQPQRSVGRGLTPLLIITTTIRIFAPPQLIVIIAEDRYRYVRECALSLPL